MGGTIEQGPRQPTRLGQPSQEEQQGSRLPPGVARQRRDYQVREGPPRPRTEEGPRTSSLVSSPSVISFSAFSDNVLSRFRDLDSKIDLIMSGFNSMAGEVKVINDTCCSQEGLVFTTLDDIVSHVISLFSATSLNHDSYSSSLEKLDTQIK